MQGLLLEELVQGMLHLWLHHTWSGLGHSGTNTCYFSLHQSILPISLSLCIPLSILAQWFPLTSDVPFNKSPNLDQALFMKQTVPE